MSEAKEYDRSYKEQSVKPALEIVVKRAGGGTEGTVRNAVRVGAGGKERYLYRHNENKEVPENAEVPAVRYGYAVGAEKGTGRTVRRNWRQVAGLRPSVHQVGRKPYEQQYSLLLVQGVL